MVNDKEMRKQMYCNSDKNRFNEHEANLDSMRHHGHFMESGLTVENDEIVVPNMTFHFVTDLQMKV